MTDSDNSRSEGAIQALVWAIEEIAKTGNKNAERYARLALKHLQDKVPDERPHGSALRLTAKNGMILS
jgi:hypothetical protein